MPGSWLSHQFSLTVFLGVLLLIVLSNLWALRRLRKDAMPTATPRVSVLVPTRNEHLSGAPVSGQCDRLRFCGVSLITITVAGRATWKGRRLPRQRVRLV